MTHELKPCGTPAAFRRHIRHGEKPCEACRAANATYQREYQAGYAPLRKKAAR